MEGQQLDLFDQPTPELIEKMTFNQFMRLFKRVHLDRKKEGPRLEALCRHMVEFFDGRMIDTIGRQDTRNLLNWLRASKNLGPWTLIKARSVLRLMFNLAETWKEDGFIEGHDTSRLSLPRKNPTLKTERPKAPRPEIFLSPFQFRGWIKAARQANDLGFEAAFRFGIWFRLSPIDLENFNDDEVDNSAFEVRIRRRHTKTDKDPAGCLQVIKLTERAWAWIERCRRFRKAGEKRIISISVNKRRRFAKIRKIAVGMGLQDVTLCVFRRSASDYLLSKGFAKGSVADSLGHTTEKMVDAHYSRMRYSPDRLKITTELLKTFN